MSAEILQAIATALVTILGCFMFYDSKKRTEAAKASQEEAKATAQYASGWKDLCERKDSELKAKDEKIDSLYDVLNQHRASEDKLKGQATATDTTKISKKSSSTKNTRNSSSDSKNSQKDTQQETKTTQASWDIWLGAGIIIGIGATTAIIWIWRKRKKPKN